MDRLDEYRKRAVRAIQCGEIDLTLRFTLQGFMQDFDHVGFFEKFLQPVKVGRGRASPMAFTSNAPVSKTAKPSVGLASVDPG